MGSDWRDWANHPEAVTAIWPRVLASGMPPAACLALLGTCQHTRDTVLHEAPRAKLAVQLGEERAIPGPLLLLSQSSRTQYTTLALLNGSTDQPPAAGHPPEEPPLNTHAASSYAQHILSHSALLGCITRLGLQGVAVDPPLLQAMQGLPALTHLHLSNIHLPASPYQPDSFPQGVCILHIELHPEADKAAATLTSLLTEFLMLDTITDLTVTGGGYACDRGAVSALEAVTAQGRQAGALRKLSLPDGWLTGGDAKIIQRAAPLLEELQVYGLEPSREAGDFGALQASWRTLRVHNLDLSASYKLPLGGTEPLDIHVGGKLWCFDPVSLETGVRHLTSQNTRPVRLVGSGRDGGAFTFNGDGFDDDLVTGLSVLQLSKAPVRRLDLTSYSAMNAEELVMALQPMTALTQLSLTTSCWYAGGASQDGLLARLPLHVERVRLVNNGYQQQAIHNHSQMCRVAVAASTVPGRQASPLHLCVVGSGPGSQVWNTVDECRTRGDMGVVMEEAWE